MTEKPNDLEFKYPSEPAEDRIKAIKDFMAELVEFANSGLLNDGLDKADFAKLNRVKGALMEADSKIGLEL